MPPGRPGQERHGRNSWYGADSNGSRPDQPRGSSDCAKKVWPLDASFAEGRPMCKNSQEEMRRVVYLARHGETDWNRAGRWQGWTDVPLNPTGEAQALALAEKLRDRTIARIVSSHLARARRTAEIVAGALSVTDIATDADLKERGFGLFEGLT